MIETCSFFEDIKDTKDINENDNNNDHNNKDNNKNNNNKNNNNKNNNNKNNNNNKDNNNNKGISAQDFDRTLEFSRRLGVFTRTSSLLSHEVDMTVKMVPIMKILCILSMS